VKDTIYETVTRQIVEAIEEGAETYRMPWHHGGGDLSNPRNAVTGRAYRGVNVLTLWIVGQAKGYGSGEWATYQQWQERGCQVRRGEKAAGVVFWKNLDRPGAPEGDGESEERARFIARGYNVFNADQVDGLEQVAVPILPESERIASAETFFAAIPARINHGASTPCFIPAADAVEMVDYARFTSSSAYYSVLAHELTHWSGGASRLARDLSGRFGSEAYAMEELIAELGAAFTASRLGLATTPRADHAPYIASWLRVLKGDSRAIFTAASKAQAASDYLAGFGAEAAKIAGIADRIC
jgi:antirestriction protein ArdC